MMKQENTSCKRILCVGLVCVDTVLTCESYPIEDSDQRCLQKTMQVGGNAANNCTVLSQIKAECEFFGTMTDNCQHSEFVRKHFEANNIIYKNSPFHNNCKYPTSVIVVNNSNGSRTILHHRDEWPEVTVEDFEKADLSKYSWVHFEGRQPKNIKPMIARIEEWNKDKNTPIRISVEIEKPRHYLTDLLSCGDVIFIGKDFAQFVGYKDMRGALQGLMKEITPNCTLIIPWGEKGAMAYSKESGIVEAPAYSPEKVVDTLGAGDTFCAAVIHSLNNGESLLNSIICGCQVAGGKVGMYGYNNVGIFYRKLKAQN